MKFKHDSIPALMIFVCCGWRTTWFIVISLSQYCSTDGDGWRWLFIHIHAASPAVIIEKFLGYQEGGRSAYRAKCNSILRAAGGWNSISTLSFLAKILGSWERITFVETQTAVDGSSSSSGLFLYVYITPYRYIHSVCSALLISPCA